MGTLRKLLSNRKFSTSAILAHRPYRPTPIIPPVNLGEHMMWKKISLFFMFPLLVSIMVKCYLYPGDHTPPEFVAYEHLRIRTKRFAWGDGNHSFFHNIRTNPLPDGYEDEDDEDDEKCEEE